MQGYNLVYVSKRENHHERVLRKNEEEIILIYSDCVLITNMDPRKLKDVVEGSISEKKFYSNHISSLL